MTRFTAAYSVDTDDEDEVLDAIDEIVDDSGDDPFFVAFSSIEGSSFVITSTELPVGDVDGISPIPLLVALSEAERYGDNALWIEPASHSEATKEIDRIVKECTIDEALNSPLSTRSEAHYKPISYLPPKKGARQATEAVKRLVAASSPTRGPEEEKAEKAAQKPAKSAQAPVKKAQKAHSSGTGDGGREKRKARPMPGKSQSGSSEDMASVKAKARERIERELREVDELMDEWTV
ncbi:hypothetical protein [uncultured Rothia sp.]|uniref:hypothetical protein n=1 Tax=uncultured Rothia sp. TaxID=316088 RepID=UPI0028DC8FEA|nr:hypothetical protein [uncultured Rothia sp.]